MEGQQSRELRRDPQVEIYRARRVVPHGDDSERSELRHVVGCVVSAPADDRPMIIGRQRALMRSTPGMYENMAISRALRKLGLPRKKKVLQAQERDSPKVRRKRREFRKEVAGLGPRRLVLVDESGAHPAMTRTHGRAPAGR
jgi:hypothetical protein